MINILKVKQAPLICKLTREARYFFFTYPILHDSYYEWPFLQSDILLCYRGKNKVARTILNLKSESKGKRKWF